MPRNCGSYENSRNHDPYDEIYLFHKMFSLTIKIRKDDLMMKTKSQRCMVCRKKVGLLGYPEKHVCTFNFKSIGHAVLAKENPLCKADKLEKRI
ncbi:hypothetical protein H5410_016570 [Solanum commersonii]|uniref:Uncharacterized protein n=1 Tax=Solanum commersonii TaxID=4109 RepID=A0A9J5ZXQ2_SOLCO|nr:hypothetical protein H5410_016570 [Solanum commersonii]